LPFFPSAIFNLIKKGGSMAALAPTGMTPYEKLMVQTSQVIENVHKAGEKACHNVVVLERIARYELEHRPGQIQTILTKLRRAVPIHAFGAGASAGALVISIGRLLGAGALLSFGVGFSVSYFIFRITIRHLGEL
jgi:hypothetical protein